MKFILQILDPSTECPTRELGFEVDDPLLLGEVLGASDFDTEAAYDLDASELARLSKAYALPLHRGETCGRLRIRCWFDDLPYQIHTDRELALMLAGMKPLASFVGVYPPDPRFEEIPERLFDPYVNAGKFIKREFVELSRNTRGRGLHRILYSLARESWRIDAYILLLQTAGKTGWNEALERMEGSLLGYDEWQNDAYFAARKAIRTKSEAV
jgi:hypothetical protein